MHFRLHDSKTKIINHTSDWSRISQANGVLCFCATLHCINYPRPLRSSLVESQALRISRRS